MNRFSQKNLIEAAGVMIILGALIMRDFRVVGLVVVLIAVGLYILSQARGLVYMLRNYRKITSLQKITLFTSLMLLYIFVETIVSGEVSYFLLLVALGVNYFIYQKREIQ